MYLEKEIHYINNLASELQLANDTVFKSYDIFGDAETELEDARVLVSELAGYTYRQADKVIHWYQKSIAAGREGDNEYSAKCMERAAQLFTGETVKHCFVKKKPFGTPCKKKYIKEPFTKLGHFCCRDREPQHQGSGGGRRRVQERPRRPAQVGRQPPVLRDQLAHHPGDAQAADLEPQGTVRPVRKLGVYEVDLRACGGAPQLAQRRVPEHPGQARNRGGHRQQEGQPPGSTRSGEM